jgi:pimeloyl-ACP methyl ester carboxylesterase
LSGSPLPSAVYAPDLPGCGRSPGPRRALGIDELAVWCARFLDAVGLQSERVDLGAHSMGCQVALALACRHPGRVGRLVLVGPTTGGRSVPLWRYLAGMMVGSSREPLVYRLLAVRMFWRIGLGRYVGTVCAMMKDDTLGRATRVAASCLVLRGGRDAIIPEFAARSLAAALPVGSYLPVGAAGHVVPFNSAVDLAPLALAFWEDEPDRGPGSKDGGSFGAFSSRSRIEAAEATSGTSGTGR